VLYCCIPLFVLDTPTYKPYLLPRSIVAEWEEEEVRRFELNRPWKTDWRDGRRFFLLFTSLPTLPERTLLVDCSPPSPLSLVTLLPPPRSTLPPRRNPLIVPLISLDCSSLTLRLKDDYKTLPIVLRYRGRASDSFPAQQTARDNRRIHRQAVPVPSPRPHARPHSDGHPRPRPVSTRRAS
jgi:hypothetical protein